MFTLKSWVFGSAGSGLHFTIVRDTSGAFTVRMLEGSMDLNALWFSDGDAITEGNTRLTQKQKQAGLGMSGKNNVDAAGRPIVWDNVEVFGLPLSGKAVTSKATFLTAGETYSLDPALLSGFDLDSLLIGVRATSVNGRASATLVADEGIAPVVEAGQAFRYTENRRADSFIGSVEASSDTGSVSYRFWNAATKTGSQTSFDGFFRIDDAGRIWLTELGAASYANNFEDIAGARCRADNVHNYQVQAGSAKGKWSGPVEVVLRETDCACDDPNAKPVYDVSRNGITFIEVKNGFVGELNRETYEYDPVGRADPKETLIRLIAPSDVPAADAGRVALFVRSDAREDMLRDVECIRLDAYRDAKVVFSSNDTISDEQLFTPDNFMSSLQKVSVASGQRGGFGMVEWYSYNYGGSDYMSSLKAIDMKAGSGSIEMELRNTVETARDDSGVAYQPGASAGDNFMRSLETIHAASQANGRVELDLRNTGGDNFMQSLTSITADANGTAVVDIEAEQAPLENANDEVIGFGGSNANFMASLKIITVRSATSSADLDLANEIGDDFMSELELIDLYSTRSQNLDIQNQGGDRFLSSLDSIVLDRAQFSVLLDLWNEQFMDAMGNMRSADDFMSSLQTLVVDTGSAIVRLRNGTFYDHDGNYLTDRVFGRSGSAYLDSLETIAISGSTVEFQLLNNSQDAATLKSLTSITLSGGKVDARFSSYMETQAWFDRDNITGATNGEQDDWFIWEASRLEDLSVLAGFGAGVEGDRLVFAQGIDSLSDLSISLPDSNGDVRITFDESTGFEGSILLIGVGADFGVENILIY